MVLVAATKLTASVSTVDKKPIFRESALHKRQSATSVIDMDILTKIAEPSDKLNVEQQRDNSLDKQLSKDKQIDNSMDKQLSKDKQLDNKIRLHLFSTTTRARQIWR